MKKLTFILAGLICMLATSCMFQPLSADITIKNETPVDIVLTVDYNQKLDNKVFTIEAGKKLTKSMTGRLRKMDLKDSSGGVYLVWMTKPAFDAKREDISSLKSSDSQFWYGADDYKVLTETLDVSVYTSNNKTKRIQHPKGSSGQLNKVTDSYTISFTGSDSSITCAIKAN